MACSMESTRIGYTKIMETICMEESQRMVSGKLMEKLACLPTQCYNALSGRFEKKFFAETPME